jgi:predicted unusual protein kinase regulating ubiquinone biosynthesis (AarF/ABC1/UbiB family)
VYGEHFLPAEANKILKSLQSNSATVSWEIMYEQILNQLDTDVLDQLEINPEPIGSASMGQVYLAVRKDTKEKVALKVQYPGVDKAIDSDVAALKRILSISKILPEGLKTDGLFNEIKSMLQQELDYATEARLTEQYRSLLNGDRRFKVPKVYPQYSTEKILATEYMEGFRADHDVIQNLSQDRRNRLGTNFLDLYFLELFRWNNIQSDPHLGNYKIQLGSSAADDAIVLLDFGATKQFTPDFISAYKKLMKGAITSDNELFFRGARDLGFLNDSDSEAYVTAFTKFCHQTVEPFKEVQPEFNWKESDLPKRVIKNAFEFRHYDLRTPPQELVFLDRKTAGVYMFLSALKATFHPRPLISPYLDSI